MGYGSYTSEDWVKLKTSSRITSTSRANEIFKKTSMEPKFDPKFIGKRESRDSEDHPDSTPIIIGLDVTGSMGYLAAQIAKESLHETMMKLFSTKPVNDPQIMFAAIGDVEDRAPLQVTQFESDIRIGEQLLQLWLEGEGGDGPEDYPLLWYFASRHTSTDRYEKRHKKGYLFTIGDNDCHSMISGPDIKRIFNDEELSLTTLKLAEEAKKKYELFHIHLGGGSVPVFSGAIPGKIIKINSDEIKYIPEIIVSVLMLCKGHTPDEVYGNWSEAVRPIIKVALRDVLIESGGKVSF